MIWKKEHRNQQDPESPSEFRRDLVSGAWITIATGRARRPIDFASKKERKPTPLKTCPFEDLAASGHGEPILVLGNEKSWHIKVVRNKYPIVKHDGCPVAFSSGPYEIMAGSGFHEVVVFSDHHRQLADLNPDEASLLFSAYQERHHALSHEECMEYILIFHNFGEEAGASLWHPHSQIIAIPVLPPDVERSLRGSQSYFKNNNKCVHCVVLEWERKEKKRIIYENDYAVALAPFISRNAFEVRIFPKKHEPRFESESQSALLDISKAMLEILRRLKKGLNDPAYNFFLHTAPPAQSAEGGERGGQDVRLARPSPFRSPAERDEGGRDLTNDSYHYYHWHIEILPRTDVSAGFEIGTGIEVAVADPDEAAKFLRNINL